MGGGATKREGGAREVLPLRKVGGGGAEKVLAMLRGGGGGGGWRFTQSFRVVFTW